MKNQNHRRVLNSNNIMNGQNNILLNNINNNLMQQASINSFHSNNEHNNNDNNNMSNNDNGMEEPQMDEPPSLDEINNMRNIPSVISPLSFTFRIVLSIYCSGLLVSYPSYTCNMEMLVFLWLDLWLE